MNPDELLVAEIFGPTWQGEGPSAGKVAAFVRLGLCDQACSWCDTPYTWDRACHDLRTELRRMDRIEVWHALGGIEATIRFNVGIKLARYLRPGHHAADRCIVGGRRLLSRGQ